MHETEDGCTKNPNLSSRCMGCVLAYKFPLNALHSGTEEPATGKSRRQNLCVGSLDSLRWVFPRIWVFPPKSSILIGFSMIFHYKPSILGVKSPYFWKHPDNFHQFSHFRILIHFRHRCGFYFFSTRVTPR